ncbi:acyl-CoA dehydrogenase family protein [Sphingomonas oligophenolica]|uniref:Acyl-CoA dehydrogenase family protein n=1 Tax=Sphingomonas oligophenolica TaxID=301154 RepID=A0ABU9YBD9_9SPHN
MASGTGTVPSYQTALEIGRQVESFVRNVVIPYETDTRFDHHGYPTEELVQELKQRARDAGVLSPHIRSDGTHLTQRETAIVLARTGLSPLGSVACNTSAPDEGNMYLLGKMGTPMIKERFLEPLRAGRARSAFFMTEPDNGCGSDPSLMKTTCRRDGDDWVVNGRKAFITGMVGAKIGIIMAKSADPETDGGACMFIVDLPSDAIRVEHVPNTLDSQLPGGHAMVSIENLRVPADQMLGEPGEAFRYAQVRLSPARLSHCMRWLGACRRANEIAVDYANRRVAFGKTIIDHEGVGFMLADNLIDLKQCELMIDWCADVLDTGSLGMMESSMTKVAVSEMLMKVADRCVQVMGGMGVSGDTVVEQIFREIRCFRIYDGPTEVHKWSLAKRIKRQWREAQA